MLLCSGTSAHASHSLAEQLGWLPSLVHFGVIDAAYEMLHFTLSVPSILRVYDGYPCVVGNTILVLRSMAILVCLLARVPPVPWPPSSLLDGCCELSHPLLRQLFYHFITHTPRRSLCRLLVFVCFFCVECGGRADLRPRAL